MRCLFVILTLLAYQNSFAGKGSELCVKDVVKDFKLLKESPQKKHSFKSNDKLKFNEYKFSIFNRLGIQNHFQGVTSIGNGLVVSGANYKKRSGHLFFLRNGKVQLKYKIASDENWHLGGIQSVGNILAVSVEPYKSKTVNETIIKFVDFSDALKPKELKNIRMTGHPKNTPSVGINRLNDGRYVLASLSNGKLNIFLSHSSDLKEGFLKKKLVEISNDQIVGKGVGLGGSSMALVKQCDGNFFLITFNNENKSIIPVPIRKGEDYATLFKLDFLSTINKEGTIADFKKPLTLVQKKRFRCKRKCNFGAGGGVLITKDKKLRLISTKFFRKLVMGHMIVSEFHD